MDITGKAMIFAKEVEGGNGVFTAYTIGFSSKDQDGNYINAYKQCRFRKGEEVPNKTQITVTKGFPYVVKGEKYNDIGIMVLEYESEEPPF